MESAAIACVKLCKASTYINWEDHSTIFLLVQSIVMDLKVRHVTQSGIFLIIFQVKKHKQVSPKYLQVNRKHRKHFDFLSDELSPASQLY